MLRNAWRNAALTQRGLPLLGQEAAERERIPGSETQIVDFFCIPVL